MTARTLAGLNAPSGAMIVMDSGLASEENLQRLRENGYRYLVVSRERSRHFDPVTVSLSWRRTVSSTPTSSSRVPSAELCRYRSTIG